MFNKRLLPLAITSFLALAAIANASNATQPSPAKNDRSCVLAQNLRASAPDYVGQSVIGGVQVTSRNSVATATHMQFPMARKVSALQRVGVMVAELEMAGSHASDSTPSSCYPALSFATNSIPSGAVGVAYTATLHANGGQPPYSWSFGQSSLPSGFAIDSNGNLTGTPTKSGNFNFHVVVSDSLKNNVTGELTLTVNGGTQPTPAAPVIRRFSASPSSIAAGGSSVLSWTVFGTGVSVRLNGTAASSPTTVSPSATTSYTLSASNSGGTVTQTVTVTVTQSTPPPPPPAAPVINSFSASPSSIAAGGSSVLSWAVSGTGVTVKLNGSAASSPTTVSPSATTSYTLSASNSGGTVTQTVTVTVTQSTPPPPPAAPVINSFSASPSSIAAGGSSVLSWAVSGTGVTVKLNGSAATSPDTVSPAATTSYTLSATNSSGTVTQTVTVTVTQPSSGGGTPTGTALTACGDITSSGTYYLANDVSSSGTCFGIDADNITLNLNGHTITYDTGGTANAPAIEGHDSWSTNNPPISGPSGSAHGGLEVYGGTIVQAVSGSTFSPVFEFGQGTFSSAPYIHNVTATFQNTGAQFYSSNFIPTGARIENNVIHDNVTNIQQPGQGALSARANFQGQAIYINTDNENPGVGDTITGNTIVGSPQGGIRTVNQHSTISGNDISMNATYSNDFCVDIPGDYTTVSNNNCHPKSGRGFHTNANHVTISDNTIAVTELKQNTEYGGCELDGTYAVQVEFDNSFLPSPPVGVQVTGNTITATAGDCNAIGLRVTSMTPAGSASFTGNTVTTTNSGGSGQDFGMSFDSDDGNTVTFTGNTFNSVYTYGTTDWDGAEGIVIGHNTWNGSPQYSYTALDGGCDPSQGGDSGAVCPGSVQITDSIPNKLLCGSYSESSVSIGGQVTQCKGQ